MKTLISFFVLLITVVSSSGQTSIYHPFPDSNSSWNYGYQPNMCVFGWASEEYSFILSGDTTINSQTYHKLSIPFVNFYTTGTCTQRHSPGYKGAIRQDVLNKKVFIVPPSSTTEELLYDFNLTIGDTVQGYIASNFWANDTVISMDSVQVGNDFRKRWYINFWYNIYLIEGIGSTYGLIEFSPGPAIDFDSYDLDCFMQDSETLFPDTNTYCQLITTTKDIDLLSNHVKVFPNPSRGSFSVEFSQPNDIKIITMKDLFGKIIFQEEINGQIKVNLENIKSGTYILTILDKYNRTDNRKIIICP